MVNEKPVQVKNRHIQHMMEENIKTKLNNMMKMNFIDPSESSFCLQVVIVPKKDGTNRFCDDYRLLNSQTIFDSEPMPDSDVMFSKLAGHKFFSTIELSKGYWQVKLTESSKPQQHLKRERIISIPSYTIWAQYSTCYIVPPCA